MAIFLLLQMISNNAFAEELVKMPKLFTHFYHHIQEHQDGGNFLQYLHDHYGGHHDTDAHDTNHSDEDKDCNLPFKHCDSCCYNVHVPAIGFVSSSLIADGSFIQSLSSTFVSENDRIPSNDLCSIWQPPKIS